MSVILGGLMGVFIGVTLFSLVAREKINQEKHKYSNERLRVKQRDILIKDYQKESEILLMNASEYRQNKKEFIDNITKVLYSNVQNEKQKTDKIKELVNDYQSKN